MPGMNSGVNVNDQTVVAAFMATLQHQGMIALLIFFTIGLAWVSLREWRPAGAAGPAVAAEPSWRQVLRIGFGILWLFDGILQRQRRPGHGACGRAVTGHRVPA